MGMYSLGMYSLVLWSGNQRSEGDGHPLLHQVRDQVRRVRVQVVRWARGGRDLTAHAGSKVHLAALQHVATRLGIVASMGLWWPPRRCLM
jgi:hypothetical protein